jgi:hypothetical protein
MDLWPPFRGFLITHIQTHGRTPLDEWSARRRDLYLHRTTQQTKLRVFLDVLPVLNWMSTDVSEVRAASPIVRIIEATRTAETSGDIQLRTRQYIPEDSELHTRRRESLKSRTTDKHPCPQRDSNPREGSQATPARPCGRNNVKVKTLY